MPKLSSGSFFFVFFFLVVEISIAPLKAVDGVELAPAKENVKVGVLVSNSWLEERYMSMAFSDFYEAHPRYRTKLALTFRDPKDDVVTAASAVVLGKSYTRVGINYHGLAVSYPESKTHGKNKKYDKALAHIITGTPEKTAAMDLMENEEVHALIGPEFSSQAKFIIDLGSKAQVPVISFSATSPSLSPTQHNSYFIRTTDDDRSQLKAIVAIIQAYGWCQVVLIYEDTNYGNGLFPHISDVFQENDIQVPYRSEIPPSSQNDDILEELYKVMNNTRARVFLVHMTASLGSRVFTIANEAGMLSKETAWIVTDGLSSLLDPVHEEAMDSMEGVLGVRPYVPMSPKLRRFDERWKGNFSKDWRLFGLWAYDTITSLAMVAEKVWNSSESHYFKDETTNNKMTTTMDYSAIGVSRVGPKLLERIRDIKFDGLSGDFHMVNGQLRASSIFEIFNVVGKQERVIGYWTQRHGLSKKLPKDQPLEHGLKPPIWPGDTTKNPRGWIPTVGGKMLRIGVPNTTDNQSFKEFVRVERIDNGANPHNYSCSGFSCDVFREVLQQLPYDIPLEFIPYGVSLPNFTYDSMLSQIKLKEFDAVIGDTSITPSRLSYVEFTIPYSEAGVSMLVQAKQVDEIKRSMWIFLKPLSWDLWLTTGLAFVTIGFIVWVFERRTNQEFSGTTGEQLLTSLWFSFSTLVFAQRERVLNKWTRLVLVIWVFVVLIITQTYTASLASFLTIQQLQSRTLDVAELVRTNQYIGYQSGSFVRELLLRLNFKESRLRSLGSIDEYHFALSQGSGNGGVAAVFDEIPYLKVVTGKYCNVYTIVGPVYQTDGFGFAFPIGSPLVPDFSKVIADLKVEHKIEKIGFKYFANESCEVAKNSLLDGGILNVYSFGGLFIIIGVVSGAAILGEFLSSNYYSVRHRLSVSGERFRTCLNQVMVHLRTKAGSENNIIVT